MAENNSSAPLLPCPFCGGEADIQSGARGMWNIAGCMDAACSGFRASGPHNNPSKASGAWNTRAPQAVAVQAAPAAPDTNRLRAEILEHASKGSRLVRTLFNEPTGTLSDVEVGDWIQRAQQYLTLPSQAAPAAVAVPDDLVELSMLNKLIELGSKAAYESAKSSSDDGPHGTAAYVRWQELRADMRALIHATYPSLATPALPATGDSSAGDLAEASHQTKLLAQALGDCILASGIVRSDLDMSGPQLLMYAEDLKELLLARQAEVQAEPVAWIRKTDITELTDSEPETDEWTPLYTAPQAQPADALDTARLDFLETQKRREARDGGYSAFYTLHLPAMAAGPWQATHGGEYDHKTLRESIDAAMAAAQEGGKA